MATLQGVRAEANRMLYVLAKKVFAVQGGFLARERRYWQAAWTHPVPPADGIPVQAEPLERPTDEPLSWAEMGFDVDVEMLFRVKIDVYQTAPDSNGYVIVAEAKYDGKLYQRSYAVGPDWQSRTHDWMEVNGGPT